MAEYVKKYKIFVASPSDVNDERLSIDEVITELNITYGQSKGIVLELLKWETHSAPAVTLNYTQDIINKDIGTDYDLLIGILWTRFGTPTGNADSGTAEEFKVAYERYLQASGLSQILFYFKTSVPDSLDKIDPLQLQKVNEFKNSLGDMGVLYWEFRIATELQSFLRLHIIKRINDLEYNSTNQPVAIPIDSVHVDEFEELGIIDYQDNIEEYFADSTSSLYRVSDALNWVAEKLNEKTKELNRLTSSKKTIGTKELRSHCQRSADIMNDFASRLEPEVLIFFKSFEAGSHAMSQIVNLTDYLSTDVELLSAYRSIVSLMETVSNTIGQMDEFLQSVSELPRVEKELNKSRRNVEFQLSDLIEKISISHSIINEIKKQFENKYNLQETLDSSQSDLFEEDE